MRLNVGSGNHCTVFGFKALLVVAFAWLVSFRSVLGQIEEHEVDTLFNARPSFDRRLRTPKSCMPIKPAKEERICVNQNLNKKTGRPNNLPPADCKDCFTQCSIMGDPHVSPLYSKCTMVVGTEVGNYLYYYVPANGRNMKKDTNLTISVYANNGNKWVKTLWLNGKNVFDADDCWTDAPQQTNGTIGLWSDGIANKKKAKADIELYWEALCRPQQDSKGSKQLIINMQLRDEFDTYAERGATKMPPATTFYFNKDIGMCVDPVKFGSHNPPTNPTDEDYKLRCNRQSEFKYTSGRFCNCTASCAAWGDPHLMSFYQNQCRNSRKCNFLTPITPDAQYNMLYHADQVFGVRHILDDRCHLIVDAQVYAMKKRSMQKLNGCSTDAGALSRGDLSWVQNSFGDDDWDVLSLKAEEMCSELGDAFQIPGPETNTISDELNTFNAEYYDATKGGFNLGTHVVVKKDGKQYLVSVTGGHSTCLEKKGFDPDEASNLVEFGGVSTTLTCHKNKAGMWYFNMCVNKKSMTVQKFFKYGKELEHIDQEPTGTADWGGGMIHALETSAFSGGWCATGNFDGRESGVSNAYEANAYQYRRPDTTRVFVRADSQ